MTILDTLPIAALTTPLLFAQTLLNVHQLAKALGTQELTEGFAAALAFCRC